MTLCSGVQQMMNIATTTVTILTTLRLLRDTVCRHSALCSPGSCEAHSRHTTMLPGGRNRHEKLYGWDTGYTFWATGGIWDTHFGQRVGYGIHILGNGWDTGYTFPVAQNVYPVSHPLPKMCIPYPTRCPKCVSRIPPIA